jgi:YD repeat-containing protein
MKEEQTIAQFLNVKDFPFAIKDKNSNEIYYENSDGFWSKCEHDDKGNLIRHENSDRNWSMWEYDDEGNEIRYENSDGFWIKREYDDKGNVIYYENSDGYIVDNRPKPMIELTLQDIAEMKGVDVSQIRIKE